jgi:hypothetical protein
MPGYLCNFSWNGLRRSPAPPGLKGLTMSRVAMPRTSGSLSRATGHASLETIGTEELGNSHRHATLRECRNAQADARGPRLRCGSQAGREPVGSLRRLYKKWTCGMIRWSSGLVPSRSIPELLQCPITSTGSRVGALTQPKRDSARRIIVHFLIG